MTKEKHLRVYTEIGKLMHVLFLHNHYSILMQVSCVVVEQGRECQ